MAASFGNDIEKCMVEHAMFLRKLEALVFGRGKSPPERLCAQAFGLARIRRYPPQGMIRDLFWKRSFLSAAE